MVLQWRSLTLPGSDPDHSLRAQQHVQDVLLSWEGTPYMPGQQCKGGGVDCVRFVLAVLEEVAGSPKRAIPNIPQDASLHHPLLASRTMRTIIEAYGPAESVTYPGPVEPGDVLVVGKEGGGPGHAMFVGDHGIWHASGERVHKTGFGLFGWRLFRIYRMIDRAAWGQEATA